jgi:effector-binding domain-containing protein
MKALRIIIIVLVVLLSAFLVVALFLPKKAYLEESMLIKASAKQIFSEVNNFNNWASWSPFREEGDEMVVTLEGPASGVGAIMKWTDEDEQGSQTIIESQPDSYMKTELDFMESGKAFSEWKLVESDSGTMVTWTLDIDGLSYPVSRYFGLFMPKMMKPIYHKGLIQLKSVCEQMPWIEGLEFKTIEAQPALIIKDSAMVDQIGAKMGEVYTKLMNYINSSNIQIAGPPFTVYYSWDYTKPFVMDIGIPIQSAANGEGEIIPTEIAAGEVVCTPYYGSYDGTGMMHEKIQQYLAAKNRTWEGFPWEVYVTDPQSEADTSKWLTMIYYRIGK